MNNLDTRHL